MSSNLARIHPTGRTELAQVAPIDEFRPLDRYSGGFATDPVRVPWLATISAGYKNQQGYPVASRKNDARWIHMMAEDQERAPGLVEALEEGNFRSLDVALPFDDPNLFLQQRFEKRSATRLEVYGDEHELVQFITKKVQQGNKSVEVLDQRLIHPAESIEYRRLVQECNVSVSFFFTLARWEGRQPRIYFPASDGLGVYRLRFTSRNSLREIVASLRQISALTGGRLAGLPLRLTLDWRESADSSGVRRTIGVWTLRFMPPQGIDLTPALWQDLKQKALAEGDLLRHVPAPTVESYDDAVTVIDADLDEPDAAAVDALQAGPPCDAGFYQKAWFARVKDTRLDSDEARAGFIEGFTGGRTDSLTEFLGTATEQQAAALIATAGQCVGAETMGRNARRYDEIFRDDDPPPARTPADPRRARLDELLAQAKERGIVADPPLFDEQMDPIAAAIAYWEQRIENHDLDQHAARESQQTAF